VVLGVSVADSSVASRVAALEARVNSLERDLPTKIGEVNRRIDSVSSELESEGRARGAESTDLRELVTNLHLGGLTLEVAGLVWILVGQLIVRRPHAFASLRWLRWLST
jgi:hypothetical protein